MAWCVFTPTIATKRLLRSAASSAKRRVRTWVTQRPRGNSNLELLLTVEERNDLYQAAEMTIVPLDENNITLADPASCLHCSRLRFLDAPPKLASYDVNITLLTAADEPLLRAAEL